LQQEKTISLELLVKILEIYKDWNVESISKDHLMGKPKNRTDDVFDSRRDLLKEVQEEIRKKIKNCQASL
jgi:hypothetical protein